MSTEGVCIVVEQLDIVFIFLSCRETLICSTTAMSASIPERCDLWWDRHPSSQIHSSYVEVCKIKKTPVDMIEEEHLCPISPSTLPKSQFLLVHEFLQVIYLFFF